MPWEPSEADCQAAWTLYIELKTRIATQPLHYRAGDEETALDSLYRLFAITRDAVTEHGPDCRLFATVATQVLNVHIRPVTAKWHRKKVGGRLQHDDDRREFRRELDSLRPKLLVFCRLLASLASGEADLLDDDSCLQPATAQPGETLGAAIPFDGTSMDHRLYRAELVAIHARRQHKGPVADLVGLACSGGGIRSATFCLGVAQALAHRGILPAVDYLSTVSGGGYFGAFLSSYLNDPDHSQVGLGGNQLPFARKGEAESAALRRLRNESKYLLKGGLLGQARMVGLMCLGIVLNLLALAPMLIAVLAVAKWAAAGGTDAAAFARGVGALLTLLAGLLVLVLLALPLVYRWRSADRRAVARYERLGIVIAVAIVGIWLLGRLMPQVYDLLREARLSAAAVIGLFAALPFGLAAVALLLGPARLTGRVLMVLAGITGPLFLVMTFFALNELIPNNDGSNALRLLFAAALIAGWLALFNVNRISPHRYYRNRLSETYLLRRSPAATPDGSAVQCIDPQPLSGLRSQNPAAPYHLINAAVNLPASKNAGLRGRRSDFFVFTQDYCGSPLVGYCPTTAIEARDPNLDLGTVMAISGAAASSFMGTKTMTGLSFWLALLNVRLAYWLPNPGRVGQIRSRSGVSPLALWRELFGRMDEKADYLNVSDGGHIENLGIYELLRRRCKFIIAIDGEADPGMAFGSLMQLVRYAQIDFGIRISLDLGDLDRDPLGHSKAHFAFGTIEYGKGLQGYLLYVKSSLTGNEPDYVRDYHRRNPTFPHETTADQFFSEAQFEAYRALGEHIGKDLFQPEFVGEVREFTFEAWMQGLRNALLEPAPRPAK